MLLSFKQVGYFVPKKLQEDINKVITHTIGRLADDNEDIIDIDINILDIPEYGWCTNFGDCFEVQINKKLLLDHYELLVTAAHEAVHICQHINDTELSEDEAHSYEEAMVQECFPEYQQQKYSVGMS